MQRVAIREGEEKAEEDAGLQNRRQESSYAQNIATLDDLVLAIGAQRTLALHSKKPVATLKSSLAKLGISRLEGSSTSLEVQKRADFLQTHLVTMDDVKKLLKALDMKTWPDNDRESLNDWAKEIIVPIVTNIIPNYSTLASFIRICAKYGFNPGAMIMAVEPKALNKILSGTQKNVCKDSYGRSHLFDINIASEYHQPYKEFQQDILSVLDFGQAKQLLDQLCENAVDLPLNRHALQPKFALNLFRLHYVTAQEQVNPPLLWQCASALEGQIWIQYKNLRTHPLSYDEQAQLAELMELTYLGLNDSNNFNFNRYGQLVGIVDGREKWGKAIASLAILFVGCVMLGLSLSPLFPEFMPEIKVSLSLGVMIIGFFGFFCSKPAREKSSLAAYHFLQEMRANKPEEGPEGIPALELAPRHP